MSINPETLQQSETSNLKTEVKANVEFWQSLGIQVDEDDVIHQLEFHHQKFPEHPLPDDRRKKKMLLYIPPITIEEIANLYGDKLGIYKAFGVTVEDIVKSSSETDATSHVLAYYSSKEPDLLPDEKAETMCPQEWQKEVTEYYRGIGTMDLKERLITGIIYGKTHKKAMDEKYTMFCPETLLSEYHCARVGYGSIGSSGEGDKLYISAWPMGITDRRAGVGQVVRTNIHLQE